jgi:hypothetical protein
VRLSVERPAPHLPGPVLQVGTQNVVLASAFVGASGQDQCHHKLEHVEFPLALLDTVLVRKLPNR